MLWIRNELAHDYDEAVIKTYCGAIIGAYIDLFFAFEAVVAGLHEKQDF